MDYTLFRSNRKTCAIYIKEGNLEVRAPLRMPKAEIDRFVDSKRGWIAAKLAEASARADTRASFALGYGDTLRYRGQKLAILAREGNRVGLDPDGFYMPPDLRPEGIKNACIQIYRLCAKAVLSEKVRVFSEAMGLSPSAVKVSGARTRWGSCSGKKSLNFSWRLMMASDPVIDYVVVHELAHLKEMNHSARFWALVERTLPSYRARQKELKALQKQLWTEDWE